MNIIVHRTGQIHMLRVTQKVMFRMHKDVLRKVVEHSEKGCRVVCPVDTKLTILRKLIVSTFFRSSSWTKMPRTSRK